MLFLLTCAFFLFCPEALTSNSTDLQHTVHKLEALARVVNGISLQSTFTKNDGAKVTSELLQASSADSMAFLESLDTSKMPGQLEIIQKSTDSIQMRNFSSVKSEIGMIDSMSENWDVLNKTIGKNPCDDWIELRKKFFVLDTDEVFFCYYIVEQWIPAAELIMNADTSDYGSDESKKWNDALYFMKNETINIGLVFEDTDSYKDIKKRLIFNFTQGPNDGVREMMKVVKVLEEYTEKYDALVNLKSELKKMSGDVKSVLPIAKESERMEELSGALKSISESVERMNEPMGARELTVGLPGGTGDLEEIFRDLDGKWLKETIAGGKDMGKLKKLLEPLKTFTEGVKKVEGSWRNVSGHPGIQKALDLSEHLKTASDNGKQAGDTDPTTAIQAVSNCLESMKPITSSPNFTHFKIFSQTVEEVERQIKIIVPILKELSEGELTGDRDPDIVRYLAEEILVNVTRNMKNKKIVAFIEAFQKYNGTKPIYDALKKFEVLRPYQDLFSLLSTTKNGERYGDDIRTALIESNLADTVDCLKKTELNVDHVDKFLKLGDSAEMIKKKLGDTKDILEFLKSLMDMKKTLGEVSGVGKKTLRRRKRASGGLEDLKNSKQISIDLGHGVMALKKLEDVRKHQKTVLEVASCGDKADSLIRTLPQVSALWTTDNKNGLTDMVKGINDLDKKCSSLSPHDLLNLSSVFDLAADIRSVPIPSQLFSDPIATSLRSSSDPDLQKSADTFQSISTLQLDFANQLSDLRAASGAMSTLGTFFDNFFGVVRTSKLQKPPKPSGTGPLQLSASTSPPSPYTVIYIIIPIILLLLIAGGVGVWYYFQRDDPFFWKRLFMNKQKLAELILLNSRYLSFQEEEFLKKSPSHQGLIKAICENMVDTVELLVKNGFWINAEEKCNTALHVAVINANVEVVEILIANGADRTALNDAYKTAEQLIPEYMEEFQKNKTDSEAGVKVKNLERIRDLFVTLKDETFLRKVPSILKPKQFMIFIADNCDKVKFEKSYANQITTELKVATHIVVKTDKDGVYEPDDNHVDNMFMIFSRSMLMKECWLEESVKKKSNMQDDYKFQVEKIRFKGQVYSSVKDWHKSFHMKEIPYLRNIKVFYTVISNWKLNALLERLGADIVEDISEAEFYNHQTARPYHLFKQKLLWIVFPTADKTITGDVSNFFVLSAEELFVLLLKREFEYDPEKKPRVPVQYKKGHSKKI